MKTIFKASFILAALAASAANATTATGIITFKNAQLPSNASCYVSSTWPSLTFNIPIPYKQPYPKSNYININCVPGIKSVAFSLVQSSHSDNFAMQGAAPESSIPFTISSYMQHEHQRFLVPNHKYTVKLSHYGSATVAMTIQPKTPIHQIIPGLVYKDALNIVVTP